MSDSSLLLFAASTAVLLAMPGPTNALLASAGADGGYRKAPVLLAASLAGYFIALALLLSLNELAGSLSGEIGLALRAMAVLVLLATAWKMWRGAGMAGGERRQHSAPGAGSVLILTLFNPKALILAFAVFPPISTGAEFLLPAVLVAGIVLASGFCWITTGAATRNLPGQPQVAVARLSSLVIGGFACYFAAKVAIELMAPVAA